MPLHPSIVADSYSNLDKRRAFMGPYTNWRGEQRMPICTGDTVSGDTPDCDFTFRKGTVKGFQVEPTGHLLALIEDDNGNHWLKGRTDLRLACEDIAAEHAIGWGRTPFYNPAAPAYFNVDGEGQGGHVWHVHGRLSGEPVDQNADGSVSADLWTGRREGWIVWQATVIGGSTALVGTGRDIDGIVSDVSGSNAYVIIQASRGLEAAGF